MDRGGGWNAYPQNVDKITCFLTPPLVNKKRKSEVFLFGVTTQIVAKTWIKNSMCVNFTI